jgi:CheY-like chemotaxis protein
VAKILVADDNSNVQKTVALALSELGVDVVAVNNGEAAVRKLADIAPDLVLADIFMPVRNGYEVCEYIKKDSRFSHVPVVLLVGAFDPLDEREAQRVGADGILKKPFVPPDPLITMVKTLLERAGADRLVAVAASKPTVSVQAKAGGAATAIEEPSAQQAPEGSHEEEFQPPVDRLSFGDGERPIAFGQLLDPPAKETPSAGTGVLDPVDDEQVMTSSRDAALGDPIFWKADEAEPETEKENSEEEADISPSLPAAAWKPDQKTAPVREEPEEMIQPVEPFELVRDQEEAGQTTVVETSILQDAASQASLNVEAGKPEDLAANPIEWMATAPSLPVEETPEAAPEWSTAVPDAAEEIHENEAVSLEPAPEMAAPEPSASVVLPPSLPSSIPAPSPELPKLALPAELEAKIAVEIQDSLKAQASLKPVDQGAEDTARSIPSKDWADLAASLQFKPIEFGMEKSKAAPAPAGTNPAATPANGQSAPASSTPSVPPDPALVEAVVQRILDKMRPQVVDIITKEFLRPIVQALVHREIEKQ